MIWSHVYRVLAVNACLALACLPLLAALTATHQPWRHPVVFTVLSLCVGPALAAAFGYLEHSGGEPAPVRALWHAYRRHARRALALWAPYTLLAAACAADALMVRHTTLGLAVCPALVVLTVLSAGSGVSAMAYVAAEAPDATPGHRPLRPLDYLAAPYALLRSWPLGLLNFVLLALGTVLVSREPLLPGHGARLRPLRGVAQHPRDGRGPGRQGAAAQDQ